MTPDRKILVVDDELPIAEILRFNLERDAFNVAVATTGPQALALFRETNPDLVILDLMLPGMDGLALCREIRRTSQVPILMLTAKDDEVDKVVGLEVGADDYVTKPFSVRELVARVRALLRRAGSTVDEPTTIAVQNLEINLQRYEVRRGQEMIDLTPREYDLLRFLVQHPGQVFSREAILNEVWGYDYFGDIRTVDVTIRRLREKIEQDAAHPSLVRTKRGVGYYLDTGGK